MTKMVKMGMEKCVENEVTVKNTDQDVSVEINQICMLLSTCSLYLINLMFNHRNTKQFWNRNKLHVVSKTETKYETKLLKSK